MKLRISLTLLISGLIAMINLSNAQVTGVDYQLRYDTVECRYDAYLVINSGTTTSLFSRIQASAQFSIVVPPGTMLSNPVVNHQPKTSGGSGPPAMWVTQNILLAATYNASPPMGGIPSIPNDYYGFVPALSPTAYYPAMAAGDTMKIFSFTASPTENCTGNVRLWITGSDPSPTDLAGPNFNHGFTMGGPTQRYEGNSPQRFPPAPVLSAVPGCSKGLEIDLTSYSSACQSPVTYSWSGPNSYNLTDEDVAIDPAGMINNGTYKVVVTDALGCKDSLEIDAIAKPKAGPDQSTCAGSTINLSGSEPSTGTWSADATNAAGASLSDAGGGSATVAFGSTASGMYNFIYTVQSCSDTVMVDVKIQDAGPDPANVNCNLTGSASLAGIGSGTWTVDPSSPGTANISDPSSPNATVSGFSVGGTYTLVWTLDGCSDSVEIIVNENCGCPIAGNTISPIDPSAFCGTSGLVNVDGNPATPAGTYLWQVSENSGAYSSAPGTNTNEDYTTIDYGLGNYSLRRIYSITGAEACDDTSNVASFLVKDVPAPPTNLTANPNPVCLGETVALMVTNVAGATYTWTASSPDAGLNMGTNNTINMTPSVEGSYTISVTATVDGCESSPSTINVVADPVPPTLTGPDLTGTDPTACDVSDGSIAITGLSSGETYTLDYTLDGSAQSVSITANGAGNSQMVNLGAGVYSDFMLTNAQGCSSGVYNGTITLTEPDAPAAPDDITASPNPECVNEPVTLTVPLIEDMIYTWTASSVNAGLGNSITNINTMTASAAGQYTISVTQSLNGCTSPPISIGVNINDIPPTPTASTVVGTNPSECGASDGFITVSGLEAFTSYTIDYIDNGTATTLTASTNASGSILISGLSEGTYSNFTISNFAGCSSGTFNGPVSLADPGSPDAPSNLTAVPNPVCVGETVNLSANGLVGATFNWTASSPDAGLQSTMASATSMTPTVAGVYTISISQTMNGCTSPSSSIEVTVLDTPADIEPADITSTDPTSCGGTDGTISISGLMANGVFDIDYEFGGNAITVNVTADASGIAVISGLGQGSYTNFRVTNAGNCSSGVFPGPVVLSDPDSPDAPEGLVANPNPACVGETVALMVTNNPNATYSWTVSPISAGPLLSTTNMQSFTVPAEGSYVIMVTQTIAGCTSPASMITVFGTLSPDPFDISDFTVTNPTQCTFADGSITIGGLNASATYTLNYDSLGTAISKMIVTDASGNYLIDGLPAGSYSNFEVINTSGCSSGIFAGPVSVTDPGAPEAPANLMADPNPSCLGETVTLTVDDNPGAVFTWSASAPEAGLGSSTTNSITMTATAAGTYTISVFQTMAGCTSPASSIEVQVFDIPSDPDASTVSGTDPSACGVSDGMITITGQQASVDFVVNYTFNGSAQSANITSDGSGTLVLTGLSPGTYADFSVTNSANCSSGIYPGPITLVEPDAPDAPTNLSADPNPICLGETVDLSAEGEAGATFTWVASSPDAGLMTSTDDMTTMTPTVAGTYTISVSQLVNGCSSPMAMISVEVFPLPMTPTQASVTSIDPSGCGNADGSIALSGYTSGDDYTITYSFNGDGFSSNLTADGSGVLLISDLASGTYTDFQIENEDGCISNVFAGPVSLVDPGSPSAPTALAAIPNPVCLGNSVALNVSGVQGATFAWTISNASTGGLGMSTGTTNTMTPLTAGIYSVMVTQSINGCTSPAASINILVRDDCLNPDFGVTYAQISLTGQLSTNDDEPSGTTYGPTVVVDGTNPSGCMPSVQASGQYTFNCTTPGEYGFRVDVCEPGSVSQCVGIPLVITVLDSSSTENPPVINHDYIATNMNSPIVIELLENDKCQSVPNCQLGQVSIVSAPTAGTFNTTTLSYVPQTGFIGRDSFKYMICQNPVTPVDCDEEWVYVNVFPGFATAYTNAMDDYNQTPMNTQLVVGAGSGVLSNDTDPQSSNQVAGAYTKTVSGKGTLSLSSDGSFTFDPALDYVGPVDFSYQVCRSASSLLCDSATLHILVAPALVSGSIGSIVWNDTNGDGRYSANSEYGIPGVPVTLYDENLTAVATTITDNGGNYAFDDIPAGNYFVEFEQPDGLEVTTPNVGDELNDSDVDDTFGPGTTELFGLIAGEDIAFIKAGYFECVRIGDLVWYDVDFNDVYNGFENGINGIDIDLYRNVNGSYVLWASTKSDHKPNSPSDDGWFEFCVAPGTYYLKAKKPLSGLVQARPHRGGNEERDSDLDNSHGLGTTNHFTVFAGQPKLDIGFGYYPEAIVGNLVWNDENSDGIQNTFEETVPDVLVQAYDVNTNDMLGEAVTDENGIYRIDYLEKKDIYLKFYPPSGMIATIERAGWDDEMDSDVDNSYGENTTRMFSMNPDETFNFIDLGLAFGVLPVTWVDVAVERSADSHKISWEVADQTNVEYYIVERMLDGEQFFTPVSDTRTSVFDGYSASYQAVDNDVVSDITHFYRVKQVDIDGKYSFSDIVSIKAESSNELKMYPNPVSEKLNFEINLAKGDDLLIKIFDTSGKMISINSFSADKTALKVINVDVNNLKSGIYTAYVSYANKTTMKKFVKIK